MATPNYLSNARSAAALECSEPRQTLIVNKPPYHSLTMLLAGQSRLSVHQELIAFANGCVAPGHGLGYQHPKQDGYPYRDQRFFHLPQPVTLHATPQ